MTNTIKILIVDDSYDKAQTLTQCLPSDSFEICQCAKKAILLMAKQHFDVLIADLQIPTEFGQPININGGKELIEHCTLSEHINKPTHIIGITSHKDSYQANKQFFECLGWPLILGIDNPELIKKIIETKISHACPKPFHVDIAIITALRKIELEAVLELPCEWQELAIKDDTNEYHIGTVKQADGNVKSILATCCSRMGMASAAAITMKVCTKFNPEFIFMTGIAAGVEGKTEFGDILVADPCWDWGSGKSTVVNDTPRKLDAPHQICLNTKYRALFQKISAEKKYLNDISVGWKSEKPKTILNLHVGPVATGATVLEDPDIVKSIVEQHRETIGVEMEAYGFAYAASVSRDTPPITMIIKSVCDFANPDKNDNWQNYAAYTSAMLAYKIIENHL